MSELIKSIFFLCISCCLFVLCIGIHVKVIKRYTYDWRRETEYTGHNITLNFLIIVVVSINKNNCLSLCNLLSDNDIYLFRLLYNNNPLLEKKISMTEKGLLHTHVIIKSVLNKASLFS